MEIISIGTHSEVTQGSKTNTKTGHKINEISQKLHPIGSGITTRFQSEGGSRKCNQVK
jgi:hypothetical protein